MTNIHQQIKSVIRDIPDFPKPGIIFKDITPILKEPQLCTAIVDAFAEKLQGIRIDAVAGIESRGFLFGLTLATKLGVPLYRYVKLANCLSPLNKKPTNWNTATATIELHTDAFEPRQPYPVAR